MKHLTGNERATLDQAILIIAKHTPDGASWSFGVHSEGLHGSSCYFDSNREQHMIWDVTSLSEVVQKGMEAEARADSDFNKIKARKIERLKAELAALEGEA